MCGILVVSLGTEFREMSVREGVRESSPYVCVISLECNQPLVFHESNNYVCFEF